MMKRMMTDQFSYQSSLDHHRKSGDEMMREDDVGALHWLLY